MLLNGRRTTYAAEPPDSKPPVSQRRRSDSSTVNERENSLDVCIPPKIHYEQCNHSVSLREPRTSSAATRTMTTGSFESSLTPSGFQTLIVKPIMTARTHPDLSKLHAIARERDTYSPPNQPSRWKNLPPTPPSLQARYYPG